MGALPRGRMKTRLQFTPEVAEKLALICWNFKQELCKFSEEYDSKYDNLTQDVCFVVLTDLLVMLMQLSPSMKPIEEMVHHCWQAAFSVRENCDFNT